MIWITGNKGLLGSYLESYLKTAGLPVIGTDRELDITYPDKITEFVNGKKISFIINCSGYTDMELAEENIETAFKINSIGVKNLALTVERSGAVLIHISTAGVFGGQSNSIYSEEDRADPITILGRSKLQGENYIRENLSKFYIIRTSWLFGNADCIVDKIEKLLNGQQKIELNNDCFATPTYIKDLADIISIFIKNDSRRYGIYHFTNEGRTTLYGLAEKIMENMKRFGRLNGTPELIPTLSCADQQIVVPKNGLISKDKVKKVLGIKIRPWEDALSEFMKQTLE